MIFKNEYQATVPFDIYGLTLFHLVAEKRSFTAAATSMGLTQSAISRRIDDMEKKLGVRLFERTTRKVHLTPAGEELYARTGQLLNSTSEILRSFQESQNLRPAVLRVGVARSIGLAYLPGFFFAFRKKFPDVLLRVSQYSSHDILREVEEGTLDAGLVCPPKSLPRSLAATHRFDDDFVLILPDGSVKTTKPITIASAKALTAGKEWLLMDSQSYTGQSLRAWFAAQNWKMEPAMELHSFDMILNLVSLGIGISLIPSRVLALYGQRRVVQRIALKNGYSRNLAVVVQKRKKLSDQLTGFIENILF